MVTGDSTSTVTAHVTSSLSHSSRVIIDTSNDDVPAIIEVAFAQGIVEDGRSTYGPGDTIQFDVVFSQEVALFQVDDSGDLPRVVLNTINGGGQESLSAQLVPSQEGLFSRTVSFEYVVESGHSQMELDYLASDSFHVKGFSIEDAFGRSASLNLPAIGSGSSLSASKSIEVSYSRPIIESVSANLSTGEYGAGEEVDFVVTFDREVAVSGTPALPLNVQSSIFVIDISTADAVLPGSFFNIVYEGKTSKPIPWDASASDVKDAVESLSSTTGDACVSRAPSLSAAGFRWAIRFTDMSDASSMQVDGGGLAFSGNSGSIVSQVTVTNEVLSGWVVDDGDASTCSTRTAPYVGGSSTDSLTFKFVILPGDSSTRLDIFGAEIIYPTAEDSISLRINGPETSLIQADPGIEGVSISTDQVISVDTTPPSVVSITPQGSTTPDGTYAVGDTLYFEVSFDKAVEVSLELLDCTKRHHPNLLNLFISHPGRHWSRAFTEHEWRRCKIHFWVGDRSNRAAIHCRRGRSDIAPRFCRCVFITGAKHGRRSLASCRSRSKEVTLPHNECESRHFTHRKYCRQPQHFGRWRKTRIA